MLIHFPDRDLTKKSKDERNHFIKTVDLTKERFIVKIADLGLAKKVHYDGDLATTSVGSPLYMAPEVMHGKSYNYKADIWSIGTIMFEMVAGFPPFVGKNLEDFK